MSTAEVSRSPLPPNIGDFEGRWVAIRDDEVIADAESIELLTQDDRVRPGTDVLYRVPEQGTYFY